MLYQLSYIRVLRLQKYKNLSYRKNKYSFFSDASIASLQLKTINYKL